MSASTEILHQEIKEVTLRLEAAFASGNIQEADVLTKKLKELNSKFDTANSVLSEGKNILKG